MNCNAFKHHVVESALSLGRQITLFYLSTYCPSLAIYLPLLTHSSLT